MELLFESDRPVAPVHEIRSCYITVHDGARLAIDIHFPSAANLSDRYPVIFIATQYQRRRKRSGRIISMVDDVPILQKLLAAGYVIAILDMRGTGASFGVKNGYDTPYAEPFRQDLADVLDWIGNRPWCSGNIGMYGYSFVAGTQLAAALTGSPWLKCIAPQQVVASAHRGFMNLGGIQNIAFRGTVDALMHRLNVTDPAMPVDDDTEGLLLSAAIDEHRAMKPSAPVLLAQKYSDSRVPEVDTQPGYSGVVTEWPTIAETGIAIMHVGSWRDLYPDETLRLYAMWRDTNPTWLVMGPWVHGAQEQEAGDQVFDLSAAMLAFYDRHLRPDKQHQIPLPPVVYTILGSEPREAWRTADSWPPPQRTDLMHLAPGGILESQCPNSGSVSYQVDYATGTSGLATRYNLDRGNRDYRSMIKTGLIHVTAPFGASATLLGHPVLSLSVTCSQPDCDIYAYLHRLLPDGTAQAVTEGFLRLSNRREGPAPYCDLGLPNHPCREEDQEPLPLDGSPVTVRIAMLPTAQAIAAGERLCLAMVGADPENWETKRLDPPPVLTVHYGKDSYVSFPMLVS